MKRKARRTKTTRTSAGKRSTRSKSVEQLAEKLVRTGGTLTDDLRLVRFAGVSLGGGKTDRTAVAILEYYPDNKRVFLRSLHERVTSKESQTADDVLLGILAHEQPGLSYVAFDVPLQMPKCLRCELKCPGVMACKETEIVWMREMHKKRDKAKRPNKMFTPYTERAAEIFVANELEEPFHPSHAMGANAAPLLARALFLVRRLSVPAIEVLPKLSLWRIGMALGMPKSHLRFHRHSVDGDESRLYILKTLMEKEIAFVYQQDLKILVENDVAFDALICALTAFLRHRGQTEKRPAGFPSREPWIEFPRSRIQWF